MVTGDLILGTLSLTCTGPRVHRPTGAHECTRCLPTTTHLVHTSLPHIATDRIPITTITTNPLYPPYPREPLALHVLPLTAPLLVTSVHLVTPQYTSLHRPVAPVVSSPAPVSVYLQRAPTDIPMCDEVGIMRTSMRSALASNPAARSPSGTFREYRSSRFVYCWM